MTKKNLPPLSLYVHIPWCIRKCPYCDFNSHRAGQSIPEAEYVESLLMDLTYDLPYVAHRQVGSIFMGGGTPSLLSGSALKKLLQGIQEKLMLTERCEITLEANPGAMEAGKFMAFRQAGVNRLSMGIQSFNDESLKRLGRIHDASEAKRAIKQAIDAGFDNFNLDLMYGLPNQHCDEALADIEMALTFNPPHLSWYQLTIEPNTVFSKYQPPLPNEDDLWQIEEQGLKQLCHAGYQRYEISAYCRPGHACQHNINYWQFGDYLGIGAGAHSKFTVASSAEAEIRRTVKIANPNRYLAAATRVDMQTPNPFMANHQKVATNELAVEFMMNALRLVDGVPKCYFSERTALTMESIAPALSQAAQQGFLKLSEKHLRPTTYGQRFLNDCLQLFTTRDFIEDRTDR